MIHSLTGEVSFLGDGTLGLQAEAVEWELAVSETALSRWTLGSRIRVLTWVQHTQDSMALFGFADVDEKRIFLELIKVSGVGPKQAMKILSRTTPEALLKILDAEDVKALSALPGLGQKTAGKIILALRGKLTAPAAAPAAKKQDELAESLAQMGFDVKQAAAVLAELRSSEDLSSVKGAALEQELFRRAIVALSS